jgi:predicted nucleic acid-binding Zn ribbon protein
MQKCPLCNKKIPEDAKFCSECGWDLTEHELTLPQIARIQEEIQYARFRAMQIHVVMVPFLTIGLVCSLVAMFAAFEVVPATWDFMINVAWPFYFIGIGFAFYQDWYRKKQDRLKMILRDRRPSQ